MLDLQRVFIHELGEHMKRSTKIPSIFVTNDWEVARRVNSDGEINARTVPSGAYDVVILIKNKQKPVSEGVIETAPTPRNFAETLRESLEAFQ